MIVEEKQGGSTTRDRADSGTTTSSMVSVHVENGALRPVEEEEEEEEVENTGTGERNRYADRRDRETPREDSKWSKSSSESPCKTQSLRHHASSNSGNLSVLSTMEDLPLNDLSWSIRAEMDLLRQEKEALERKRLWLKKTVEAAGLELNELGPIVRLNVGGKEFITTPATLESANGSVLYSIVKHTRVLGGAKLGSDQEIFIDRDGTHFAFVLAWLRAKSCSSAYKPPPMEYREDVLIEAEYYTLTDLVDLLTRCKSTISESISQLEFLKLKTMGAFDFDGSNFSRGNYSGMRFASELPLRQRTARHADFSYSDLSNTDFSRMNVSNACFIGAILQGANFNEVTLTGSQFEGALLDGATFVRAKLENVDFSTARSIRKANFSAASMEGVSFRSRKDLQGVSLERSVLISADFSDANLQRANLRGAQLQSATLRDACLRYSSMQPSDHQKLNHGSQEQDTNLQNADLENADLLCSTLQRVDFRHANLNNVNLSGASLSQARFDDEYLVASRNRGILHTRRLSN